MVSVGCSLLYFLPLIHRFYRGGDWSGLDILDGVVYSTSRSDEATADRNLTT